MSVFSCEESAETLDGELAEALEEEIPKVENDFEKADEPGIFQILDRLEKATDNLLSR